MRSLVLRLPILLLLSPMTHAQEGERFALTISGGISLGAYEAGLNWAIVRYARDKGMELAAVSGASAGTVNALLTAMTWCEAPGGPRLGTVGDNIFRQTWLPVGLDVLLPEEGGGPPQNSPLVCPETGPPGRQARVEALLRELGDPERHLAIRRGLMRSDELVCRSVEIAGAIADTGYRPQCQVPLGFTLTRADPGSLEIAKGVKVDTQRFSITWTARTAGDRLRFEPRHTHDSPALGLALVAPYGEAGIAPLTVVDYVRASSAFPVAFAPQRLPHCVATEGQGSPDCPKGMARKVEAFFDGGIFDNLPLGLAVTLAEDKPSATWSRNEAVSRRGEVAAEPVDTRPVRYIYLDPRRRRQPKACVLPSDIPEELEDFGCALENPADCVGVGHLLRFGGGFIQTARQYELQWVGRTLDFRGEERRLEPTRRFPALAGTWAWEFGGFIDEPLRLHDYFAGIYDALHLFAARLPCEAGEDEEACLGRRMGEVARDLGVHRDAQAQAAIAHFASLELREHSPFGLDDCNSTPSCTIQEAVRRGEGGSASTLARSLAKRGYVPQDQAAKALLAEPNGSMRRLTLRYAQRLQLLEEADRNPQAEAFFEAGEFALRTVLDRRRPWTFELDPSTIPDETFGFWRMAQQLLVPYTVAGVIGGRGQHITMLEPAFQLGPAPFALSLAMQPWLQPRRNEAYFNNVLSLVWQRPWWPYISSLRIGGSLNGSWFGDRPEVDSCFGEDRYCAGVEASIGLFWEKLRIAGGALRLGRECDARGIFDAERGDCGDGYVSVGISDVRGFVYWLGRVLSE